MNIFSEMAIEARSGSCAKPAPARAPRQKPQPAIPAKPQPTEQVPAPEPAPAEQDLAGLSDDDVMRLSAHRVRADTERLTRRSMKECVSDRIQDLCRENPDFARRVLHPRKSMVRCFRYIYRKAQEYARQEMKDMGEEAENGVYGIDIPDGLCFQWAEAYFNDPDAPEDQDKPKAVPRPAAAATNTPAKKPPEKKSKAAIDGQISLLGEAGYHRRNEWGSPPHQFPSFHGSQGAQVSPSPAYRSARYSAQPWSMSSLVIWSGPSAHFVPWAIPWQYMQRVIKLWLLLFPPWLRGDYVVDLDSPYPVAQGTTLYR